MASIDEHVQKYVYILLSKTSTIPSKIIRAYTREPYAHTSLALDIELKDMYSFARKEINNPFDCGFIYEDIEAGIFGRDVDTMCSVYALPVTDAQYVKISGIIDDFKANKDKYAYNYLGIVGVVLNKSLEPNNKYFCSQFVDHVLVNSGIQLFEKEEGLVSPRDFKDALRERRIYRGLLTQYRSYLETVDIEDVEGLLLEAAATADTDTLIAED